MDFRELYDAHVAEIFRVLHRLGVPERVLPDAVQEVFTTAFRVQQRFEGRSSMRTWLFGIARRVASDYRRSAPARREVLEDEMADRPDERDDASTWLERSEACLRAEALLRTLPEEQRTVFALFEVEGWTGSEIAASLEVPVATVHSRLRLAREAVRRALEAIPKGQSQNVPTQAEVKS